MGRSNTTGIEPCDRIAAWTRSATWKWQARIKRPLEQAEFQVGIVICVGLQALFGYRTI